MVYPQLKYSLLDYNQGIKVKTPEYSVEISLIDYYNDLLKEIYEGT